MSGQIVIIRLALGLGQTEHKATDTFADPVVVQVAIRALRQL
jgi:hypothetical protein